jgi:peptidyl-prolyl cis-trans isomerase B (cyclophilin B)
VFYSLFFCLAAASAPILLSAGTPVPANPYVQIERLEASRSLGNGALAGFVTSSDRRVAIRAALAIGRTKQKAGVPLLVGHVGDSDIGMRAMSVYALGLIGGMPATQPVLNALLHDRAGAVQVAALDATDRLETAHMLTVTQERQAGRRIRELLGVADVIVRGRSATALEAFHGSSFAQDVVGTLARAYAREPDSYVRWHIVWTLFRAYAKRAPVETLEAALHDRAELVRVEAVRAFGRRGDKSAIALLQPLTDDPSWRVQEQTLEAINALQGKPPTAHLKAIPAGVHTPAPEPDKFASLKALLPCCIISGSVSAVSHARAQKPTPDGISTATKLDPTTIALMTGPANGPHPRVRLVTTQGNIYIELFPEWAPLTVENFLNLTNAGYYDNNPWFRIVPDFVVQTGDPTGDGNGDAGYTIPAEENPIEQNSYIISMGMNYTDPPNAHAIRDSAGTQFYITLSPQLHLNRDFTVFGRVIGGTDVLGRLIESDKIIRAERIPDSP